MPTIGFLGVGHLAAALVEGFLRSGRPPQSLILAPRGQGVALAERHRLTLAEDNIDLVRRSDLVILATRPKDAATAIAGLPWRDGQVLLSACAGIGLEALRGAAPAGICRIMPLTAAAFGASPTTLHPAQPAAEAALAALGPVIALESEEAFEAATVSAAVYGWAQALIARSADWQARRGLDAAAARRLAALTFVAAGRMIAESGTAPDKLLAELATPGGITERGLSVLARGGALETWDEACEAVLARLCGSA